MRRASTGRQLHHRRRRLGDAGPGQQHKRGLMDPLQRRRIEKLQPAADRGQNRRGRCRRFRAPGPPTAPLAVCDIAVRHSRTSRMVCLFITSIAASPPPGKSQIRRAIATVRLHRMISVEWNAAGEG